MNKEIEGLNKKAAKYAKVLRKIEGEVRKVIVGNDDVVEKLLIALVNQGHVLLEGVPGLAKTLMVKTLSDVVDCDFVRLQFTPDLLPADIVGTKIYNHKNSSFFVSKGPIFSNFVLADEINRAPPKVQSALLEAMQEKQVSIQGETFVLDRPFFVLATQNPIESEGTYNLPEAQVDRFMFKLIVRNLGKDGEEEIIRRFTEEVSIGVKKVVSVKEILEMQNFVRKVYVDDKIRSYVAEIVDATRHPGNYGIDCAGFIDYGASPRASLWLILAAKAYAMLNERGYVLPKDVRCVAHDVLRHRVLLSYEAEAEGVTSDEIVARILDKVKVP